MFKYKDKQQLHTVWNAKYFEIYLIHSISVNKCYARATRYLL